MNFQICFFSAKKKKKERDFYLMPLGTNFNRHHCKICTHLSFLNDETKIYLCKKMSINQKILDNCIHDNLENLEVFQDLR